MKHHRGCVVQSRPSFLYRRACLWSFAFFFWLTACTQAPEPNLEQSAAPPPQSTQTEWAVLIDNSRSIQPNEQVLIREATMLLGDLADLNDRISVITFGSQARQAASVQILSDNDRVRFQDLIRNNVKFDENYSDIRAGLRLLAACKEDFFPTPQARHAAIVLSDGLLEPADRKIQRAFQELRETVRGALQSLRLFTITLGETGSLKTIPGLDPALTGAQLMEREIARDSALFTHARQLDQVPNAILAILKSVKGIASPEESKPVYRIDRTVEKMTLIVRKRTVDGKPLASSSDILLQQPKVEADSAPSASAPAINTLYRNSGYEYFDLIVVRNPQSGEWQVSLKNKNGQTPQVLSKIDSPIHLQVKAKPNYYSNESDALWAWLWDDQQGAVARGDYQLQAHVVGAADSVAQIYLPLSLDPSSALQYLDMPHALRQLLGDLKPETDMDLEIKATSPGDSMFLRQTTVRIRIMPSLIDWRQTAAWLERAPFTTARPEFGGSLDTRHPDYGAYDVPPKLMLVIERYSEEKGTYEPFASDALTARPEGATQVYATVKPFSDYQAYRYRYELTGTTPQGEKRFKSPWFALQLRFPWTLAGITATMLLTLLHLAGGFMAKLSGQIEAQCHGQYALVRVSPRREFDSRRAPELAPCEPHFKIKARRMLWFHKYLQLTIVQGQGVIEVSYGRQRRIAAPESCCLRPGRHKLTSDHASYDLNLHII